MNHIDKMSSIELANKKLDNVSKVTQENINIVFKNMSRMGDIEEKTVILQESSQQFAAKSRSLRIKSCCKMYGCYIGIAVLILCIITTIIIYVL